MSHIYDDGDALLWVGEIFWISLSLSVSFVCASMFVFVPMHECACVCVCVQERSGVLLWLFPALIVSPVAIVCSWCCLGHCCLWVWAMMIGQATQAVALETALHVSRLESSHIQSHINTHMWVRI